jgi:putative ABC transport system permease protein
MYKKYLVISWRNLLRNKVFTSVSIFGLAVGMAACFAILQYVHFEMSYDKFHKNADRIYRVILQTDQSYRATNHPAAGPALKEEFPEVIEYARAAHQSVLFKNQLSWSYTDKQGNKKVFNLDNAYFVDSSFITMFSFPFIYGDPGSVLENPNDIAISKSVSQKFFGDENPIGKELRIDDSWPLTVSGVFEDIPENSSIKFDALLQLQLGGLNNSWVWPLYYTYVKLDSLADPKKLQAKMQDFADKYLGEIMKKYNWRNNFILQPMTDIHLKSPVLTEERSMTGNILTVYFLVIIAMSILAIAMINYINLATAKSIERAKEVGLRKVAGAARKRIIFQFLFESALINLFAIFLSIIFLIIFLVFFNHIEGNNAVTTGLTLKLFKESNFWISLPIMFFAGTFLAGTYPAFVLSGFNPVSTLKGSHALSKKGIIYRKILVSFQFFVSLALITGTMIVYRQVVFMRNQDLGFIKDKIMIIKSPAVIDSTILTKIDVFRNEIKSKPQIENFTSSSAIPGEWIYLNQIRAMGQDLSESFPCHFYSIDQEFLDTYGIGLVAGRTFKKNEYSNSFDGKTNNPVLLNEEAVKKLGFANPQASINKLIVYKYSNFENVKGEIIGVVKNYHQRSLKENIDPILFHSLPWYSAKYFSVKGNLGSIHESIDFIKDRFTKIFPGNYFEYFFLDEYFDNQYSSDKKFGRFFAIFTFIAIIVAYLGLFGLTTYLISRRTKEIAIRKILGATIQEILLLFVKDFVWLILIAAIVEFPCMYFLGKYWLNNFAFKINVGLMIFILPVLILLIITIGITTFQTIKSSLINPAETLKYE